MNYSQLVEGFLGEAVGILKLSIILLALALLIAAVIFIYTELRCCRCCRC